MLKEIVEQSVGHINVVPWMDPTNYLISGTLDQLDEESDEDDKVFWQVMNARVDGVCVKDIVQQKQHNQDGGLNIALELVAKVTKYVEGNYRNMDYLVSDYYVFGYAINIFYLPTQLKTDFPIKDKTLINILI